MVSTFDTTSMPELKLKFPELNNKAKVVKKYHLTDELLYCNSILMPNTEIVANCL